ncbi:MAG: TolC family protein [Myxococcota bacterium]
MMFPGLVLLIGALGAPADDATLARLVWDKSPELQAARARIAQTRADLERARLLPNPGLDVSYNTIPVGPHNPTSETFFNIPNLQVGVSELVELGKRGPRQDAAEQLWRAARLDAVEQLRERFFDVKEIYADVATAQARIASFSQLVEGATRLRELEEARTVNGETSSLDLDRARVEEEKLRSSLAEEKERLRAALRSCTLALADTCEPFPDAASASQFLATLLAAQSPGDGIEQRPDLASLDAQAKAARFSQTLAQRRAIPDLTVRFGYVKDWFVISGNQPNSLFVGVSVPLPVFDHGQHDAQAAAVLAESAERARGLLIDASRQGLAGITQELAAFNERLTRLRGTTIPLARKIVERLEQAVGRGAAPLQDLIIARRTLEELSIDALDLEFDTFKLTVTRGRLAGSVPPLPDDLHAENTP